MLWHDRDPEEPTPITCHLHLDFRAFKNRILWNKGCANSNASLHITMPSMTNIPKVTNVLVYNLIQHKVTSGYCIRAITSATMHQLQFNTNPMTEVWKKKNIASIPLWGKQHTLKSFLKEAAHNWKCVFFVYFLITSSQERQTAKDELSHVISSVRDNFSAQDVMKETVWHDDSRQTFSLGDDGWLCVERKM